MQQISARSDNFDIIQHSDQPTIVQNQHLTSDVYDTSHYLANKILASQNNFGMAVLPDPFSKGLARARLPH